MKGNKFFYNVKTHWISMLFLAKWVYLKFYPFIVKIHDEIAKSDVVGKNLSFMSDVEVILGLPSIFPMFECVHALIKVAQGKDVFVCDFVEAVKMTQQEFYTLYYDLYAKFEDSTFDEFNAI